MDRLQGIAQGDGQEDDIADEEQFLGDQHWDEGQQARQDEVDDPIRIQAEIEEVILTIDRPVWARIVTDDSGIMEVGRLVLGGEICKAPDWDHMEQDKRGEDEVFGVAEPVMDPSSGAVPHRAELETQPETRWQRGISHERTQ
jgi:hypothetical protein